MSKGHLCQTPNGHGASLRHLAKISRLRPCSLSPFMHICDANHRYIMNKTWILLILTLALCSSCIVSKQQYDDLLAEKVITDAELAETKAQLETAEARIATLEAELEAVRADSSELASRADLLEAQLATLRKEHKELQGYYDNVINNRSKLSKDLEEQRRSLLRARDSLIAERERNEALASDLDAREARVAELERIIDEKNQAVTQLRKKISDALFNFAESELSVEVKNGKVYVSLSEKLLFQSGSRTVDPKGVEALKTLADVLKTQPDIHILVEGHTDNVPIGGSNPYRKDNWDLSVLRATSIVNILTQQGVEPSQVTAAGRGEYVPVASNDTAEDRALNRRTEIILTPELDELLQILGGE